MNVLGAGNMKLLFLVFFFLNKSVYEEKEEREREGYGSSHDLSGADNLRVHW